VHAAALDDLASVLGWALSRSFDPRSQRIKANRMLEDDLIRSEVTFP
jgi:hypothetical protein